jgi:hypothetical protein
MDMVFARTALSPFIFRPEKNFRPPENDRPADAQRLPEFINSESGFLAETPRVYKL